MSEPTKVCTKCGETKVLEVFFFRSKAKNVRQHECKACWKIRMRERYAAIKDRENARRRSEKYRAKARESLKIRRKKNPIAYRNANAAWAAANKQIKVASERNWRLRNVERVRDRARRQTENLTDAYVRGLLGGFDELIPLKREQLEIIRANRQLIQAIKEKQGEH